MDLISSNYRRRSSSWKEIVNGITVIFSGGVAAAIPFTGFYYLWSWCMTQVLLTSEWAGLVKIGITLVMVLVGGGATVGLAIFGGILAASVAVAILDL